MASLPLSVVVCARNRATTIGRCLSSVADAHPSEIIVVDGNSVDETAAIALPLASAVLSDGGRGLATARQLGADAATTDIIVYVDSDTIVLPDTLALLLHDMTTGEFDAVEAQLLPPPGKLSYWQQGEAWRRTVQEPIGPAAALGCHATIMRRVLAMTITFDSFFHGAAEDGDFFFRAAQSGARFGRSSAAIAYHEDRKTALAFLQQRIWHGRGLVRVALRNRRPYGRAFNDQATSMRLGLIASPRYIPFMAFSLLGLSWGMTAELVGLLVNGGVRGGSGAP
jgi:glycosyltransferase involved in cell wall biosynthesis